MRLQLSNLKLPLGDFALELDAELEKPITGLFGASGAGKTSLLDLVAGLRFPERGRVLLDSEVLCDVPTRIFVPPRRRRIGYVPQDLALFPHRDVRTNVTYGINRSETDAVRSNELFSLEHVAHIMEISALLDRRVTSLSGGEQQRVAFARAILSQPRFLLLDEPMSSLDSRLKKRLIPFLLRIRDEFRIPFIYVTHDSEELAALCDEVLIMERGRIVERGEPRAVLE